MARRTEAERRREARAKLAELKALAERPGEQARFALKLLETERDLGVVGAAAAALAEVAEPAQRAGMLRVFASLQADPTKRDPGGHTRMALLRALRAVVTPEDGPFLANVAATYEYLPTGGGFEEVAGGMRGLGLVTLAEVDERLAAFHAMRLLVDPLTPIISGEPAITGARVLAGQGNLLPLYGYVLGSGGIPEVIAECLRLLSELPASLLPEIIERYLESEDETVLLGLFDLLLSPNHKATGTAITLDYLEITTLLDLARYLATTLVVSRDESVVPRLEAMARSEVNWEKRRVLEEALALR